MNKAKSLGLLSTFGWMPSCLTAPLTVAWRIRRIVCLETYSALSYTKSPVASSSVLSICVTMHKLTHSLVRVCGAYAEWEGSLLSYYHAGLTKTASDCNYPACIIYLMFCSSLFLFNANCYLFAIVLIFASHMDCWMSFGSINCCHLNSYYTWPRFNWSPTRE